MSRPAQIAAAACLIQLAAATSSLASGMLFGFGNSDDCPCKRPRIIRAAPPPSIGMAYPICFYDVDLGAVGTARESWPSYSKKLEAVLGGIIANRKKVTIVSSRTAVVWAPKYSQNRIGKIWPEIACVGQSGGGTSEDRRKVCVKFVSALVKSNLQGSPMPENILEPVCQTFLGTE
jgi:hypothetical protein